MKTKQILFLMCSLLLIFGVAGCDKTEAVPDELIGSWKLKGLGETDDNTLRELEPKNCEKCYTLILKADRTFLGFSSSNSLGGSFIINKKAKTFRLLNIEGTEVGEFPDGYLFAEYLESIDSYSFIEKNLTLKLYFSKGEKYLLFKKL